MTPGEQRVKIAAKLYQCRDTAKNLHRAEYPYRIHEYKEMIKAYMAKHSTDNEIDAAIGLCDEYKDMDGAGMFTMMIMAAAVEIVEPS